MKKVFIATTTFAEDDPSLLKTLVKAKISPTMNPYGRRLSEIEITDILVKGQYDGLLAGLEPLTEVVLTQAKSLKVISRVGVGMDNIDQVAAKKLGIKVFNTPGVLTDAVAELTLGLILAALRKISLLDRKMRAGVWDKQMGALLKGKTVGIVGFGHIGTRVADLVLAFGAKVIFTDVRKLKKAKAKQVSLAQLIKLADIISLHCSGKEALIGEKEIQAARTNVIIINTARGSLIDEKLLLEGLSSGKIACAGLDVFSEEPYKGELLKQDNVILTPHVGSYAKEARILMEAMAVENLIQGLKGRE
ncbi:MAG: phosphoglycerate dehydrogenase [Candidatus Omnitrophica bacterium]|nr:phosphoglycerate dehydrogenase [Candidatus Omnitrophota bacterium]